MAILSKMRMSRRLKNIIRKKKRIVPSAKPFKNVNNANPNQKPKSNLTAHSIHHKLKQKLKLKPKHKIIPKGSKLKPSASSLAIKSK